MDEIRAHFVDIGGLLERTRLATTREACEACLPEITMALASAIAPAERARLLICRARVRSYQTRDREACEDATEAMTLFATAGDTDLSIDAASLGAAHASRLGDVALASDLATRSILGLESVTDDRLRMEITNRLGIFCYYYLDYDRAVEQFELSLGAAERIGDIGRVCRELFNVADALLLASRQDPPPGAGTATEALERAYGMARRLVIEEQIVGRSRLGSRRLLAEVLCDLGRVDEAVEALETFWQEADETTRASECAELPWVEARCLRLSGRIEEALVVARRDVEITEASGDEHDLMLAREELAACEEAAGDLRGALADARSAKEHMWEIHRGQTRQLVRQVWAHVDLERDRGNLRTRAAEATRSAEQDALTGLGNRRRLERFLGEEVPGDTALACIIADIDSFKEINDKLGHDVGDAVLRRIADLFLSNMRPRQEAIRYGGDEFVLVLAGVSVKGAYRFAEQLRRDVSSLDWTTIAPGIAITLSFGVASGPAADWQVALTVADERLLAAKRRGRNTVVMASIGALTG